MKKNEAVAAAEAAVAAAHAAVQAAAQELERRNGAYADALQALQAARKAADAGLPSCRIVKIARYGKRTASDFARAVIVRSTPGGMLIVRREGDTAELRFKASKFGGVFREDKKTSFLDYLELRDVPAEYLPKADA